MCPIVSKANLHHQGENLGKGGIDIIPNEERSAPAPPFHLQVDSSLEVLERGMAEQPHGAPDRKLLPRETGQDIGMGSPVPLSREAVKVITALRNMKDEDEDWSRWRDVVFRAKGKLTPTGLSLTKTPPPNQRKRGGHRKFVDEALNRPPKPIIDESTTQTSLCNSLLTTSPSDLSTPESELPAVHHPPQFSDEEVLEKVATMIPQEELTEVIQADNLYCPECYLPLHPDPKPERLYIFLHALRYATSLGTFETEMPEWAAEGYIWDQS